jgi:hypothetical protein
MTYIAAERLEVLANARVLNRHSRISTRSFPMRASHIAVISAVLAIPTVGYAQDNGATGGPVGGKVGSDLNSSSPAQPGPSVGHPYGSPPPAGPTAGSAGSIAPGQVVPQNVPITPRPGGGGSAVINGRRVLIDPNTNRVLRVLN